MSRRKKTLFATIAMVTGLVTFAHPQRVSKMALVTIDDSIEISAPANKVWDALTKTDMAHSWYPGWRRGDVSDTELQLKVGAQIPFGDAYGNDGVSFVVFVDPHQELRISHVPDNGTYVCQATFKLSRRGDKTVVQVTEQYSDDIDVSLDRDTAATTKTEVHKYLLALKRLSEGQPIDGPRGDSSKVLDGLRFTGEIGEKGKNAFASDEVWFVEGKFRSKRCNQYNFGEAVYVATQNGDVIEFEAETLSPTDGRMKWKGTVKGSTIDAHAEWYDKTGKFVSLYWMKGKLK